MTTAPRTNASPRHCCLCGAALEIGKGYLVWLEHEWGGMWRAVHVDRVRCAASMQARPLRCAAERKLGGQS